MSAICAVYRRDGAPVPAAQITTLLDALGEYGSEVASWEPEAVAAPIALGCRPWLVTPQDTWYRPPIHSADGRLVLVADARIDNRMELASTLGISAAEARELPDAAFIQAELDRLMAPKSRTAVLTWRRCGPRWTGGRNVWASSITEITTCYFCVES